MPTSLISTGVQFPDNSIQTTAATGGAKAANVQTFNTSGTWTKPTGFGASARVYIQCWGGGGSGGFGAGVGSGGAGGAYNERWINLADLGSTETVTIGAGGAARTATGSANAGGNSSFGTRISAFGGGGGFGVGGAGSNTSGGYGGGQLSAGSTSTGGGTSAQSPGAPFRVNAARVVATGLPLQNLNLNPFTLEGSPSGVQNAFCVFTPYTFPTTTAGGGGGSWDSNGIGAPGAGSIYAGGGGGMVAFTGSTTITTGGTSSFGGNGGTGGSPSGTAGTAPGGGGGGGISGSSGAGAAGRIVVTVIDGA
jgi:hypothetical protein